MKVTQAMRLSARNGSANAAKKNVLRLLSSLVSVIERRHPLVVRRMRFDEVNWGETTVGFVDYPTDDSNETGLH